HEIEYALDELRAELERNGFTIRSLHSSVYDMPLVGLIDIVGGLSLRLYRRLTTVRRRLARRHPEDDAGFFVVCDARWRWWSPPSTTGRSCRVGRPGACGCWPAPSAIGAMTW